MCDVILRIGGTCRKCVWRNITRIKYLELFVLCLTIYCIHGPAVAVNLTRRLEGRCLLEGSAFIWGPALIRGNTVFSFKFQFREIVTAMVDKKSNENIAEVSLKTDFQSPSNYQKRQCSNDKNLQQNGLALWVTFQSFQQVTT